TRRRGFNREPDRPPVQIEVRAMTTYVTPGVYVNEIKVFPPSVAEVETAIPAFIGYTQTARMNADKDLVLKPTPIVSMTQFEQYYGDPQIPQLSVTISDLPDGSKDSVLTSPTAPIKGYVFFPDSLLSHAVRHFFENGGGRCYIVSVGLYQGTPA